LNFHASFIAKSGSSTDERTIIATEVPADVCLNNKLPYACTVHYELSDNGSFNKLNGTRTKRRSCSALLNSLVLNF